MITIMSKSSSKWKTANYNFIWSNGNRHRSKQLEDNACILPYYG